MRAIEISFQNSHSSCITQGQRKESLEYHDVEIPDCVSCGIKLIRMNKLEYHLVSLPRPETHMVVPTVRL